MINDKNLKKNLYKPFDCIILLLLVALIVALFLIPSAKKTNKFEAIINGEKVFEYNFSDGSYNIFDSSAVEVIGEDKFKFKSSGGYNCLQVVKAEMDAYVYETDCGITKECTKMLLSQGSIICVPHSLVIRFSGEISPPKVG